MSSNVVRAAILTQALEAGMQGNREVLEALYTDDVTAWSPAHATSGRAELLAELDRRDDAFSDIELEITTLDVGGEYAGAEWRAAMTHTGDLELRDGARIEPTGLRITINGVTIAEFQSSRICAIRQYWDELTVFDQLGLIHNE